MSNIDLWICCYELMWMHKPASSYSPWPKLGAPFEWYTCALNDLLLSLTSILRPSLATSSTHTYSAFSNDFPFFGSPEHLSCSMYAERTATAAQPEVALMYSLCAHCWRVLVSKLQKTICWSHTLFRSSCDVLIYIFHFESHFTNVSKTYIWTLTLLRRVYNQSNLVHCSFLHLAFVMHPQMTRFAYLEKIEYSSFFQPVFFLLLLLLCL